MLRHLAAVALVASGVGTLADCSGEDCSEYMTIGEGDPSALLQVHARSADCESPSDGGSYAFSYPCPAPTPPMPKKVVIGVLKTVFHNVTGWVYALAMEQMGIDYQVVDQYGHYQLYPMFTGTGKGSDPYTCEEEGCADLCQAQGLGTTSPCIDMLVDSQTPGYHAPFTNPVQKDWKMAGTSFEGWFQTLWVPKYSQVRTLTQAAQSSALKREIYAFPPGEDGGGCEAMFCPACPGAPGVDMAISFPYIAAPPLSTAGYTVKVLDCPVYKEHISKLLAKRVGFLAYGWNLSPFNKWFGYDWVPLDLQQYRNQSFPVPRIGATNIASPGKALIRKDSLSKFTRKALGVIAAIYIGNDGVAEMCGWALETDEASRLCPYASWSTACAREAAHKWIQQNNYSGDISDGITPSSFGVWPSFFW